MKKIIFFKIATLLISFSLSARSSNQVAEYYRTFGNFAATQSGEDENNIRAIVNTLEEGWNSSSGKKFASPFAEAHDYIVWSGFYFPNQSKTTNAAVHQMLFDGRYKATNIKVKIDKIKFIRPDIALVHVLSVTFEKGKEQPADPTHLISMVMEKTNNKWEIISLHNLDLEVFQNKEMKDGSPIPLHVMYASWYKK